MRQVQLGLLEGFVDCSGRLDRSKLGRGDVNSILSGMTVEQGREKLCHLLRRKLGIVRAGRLCKEPRVVLLQFVELVNTLRVKLQNASLLSQDEHWWAGFCSGNFGRDSHCPVIHMLEVLPSMPGLLNATEADISKFPAIRKEDLGVAQATPPAQGHRGLDELTAGCTVPTDLAPRK